MKVEVFNGRLSPTLLKQNPEKIYVFGDNLQRWGTGGQAVIRNEHNAFGIATKRYPSMSKTSFFSDLEDEFIAVKNDIDKLVLLSKERDIVFPSNGIGTGLSQMKTHSPTLWKYLNDRLLQDFKFDNYL